MLPKFLADLDPDIYLSNNYLVLDFETDNEKGYGHARDPENQLLLSCVKLGPGHPFIKAWGPEHVDDIFATWGNELEHGQLLLDIEGADFIVAHAAKYEMGWLQRMGVDLRKVLPFDTMLAEYCLLGNLVAGSKKLGMRPMKVSLDMCCRRRGLPIKDPVVDTMIKNGINPREIPRAWLQGRCEQDVVTTEQVFLSQRTELQRRGLLPAFFTRCLLTPVLADIEQEGMAVDPASVEAEYSKYRGEQLTLQQQMDEFTGGINTRSPAQMGKFLYGDPEDGGLGFRELANKKGEPKRNAPTKQFPAGAPMTDLDTIEALTATTKKQKAFFGLHQALNKVNSILSKNLDFFWGVAQEYGGQFFGEIHQTRTATHRTASQGVPLTFQKMRDEDGEPITRQVQFQNFPRILKKLLRAKRPGWLMAEPDGSQIEFRCAAQMSNDERGIADILDLGFDAHVQTASVLHACSKEEVLEEKRQAEAAGRDDWRQLAKPDTYKPLYGGKYGTPEQERYYKWFREHYRGISGMQDRWVEEAVDTKRQVTPWGLTYYWPRAKRDQRGRVNCETQCDNYPIQALATAEIVPIAVVYLWHRIALEGIQAHIVNLVHDSSPTELEPSPANVEAYTRVVKQAYTHDVYNYLEKVYGMKFDKVPLGVGLKIGTHWGTGKEQSWDIWPDGREVKRK